MIKETLAIRQEREPTIVSLLALTQTVYLLLLPLPHNVRGGEGLGRVVLLSDLGQSPFGSGPPGHKQHKGTKLWRLRGLDLDPTCSQCMPWTP